MYNIYMYVNISDFMYYLSVTELPGLCLLMSHIQTHLLSKKFYKPIKCHGHLHLKTEIL